MGVWRILLFYSIILSIRNNNFGNYKEVKFMRRFIYYDKDGIESYLAQITSGISFSSSKETTNSNEIEQQESNEKNSIAQPWMQS